MKMGLHTTLHLLAASATSALSLLSASASPVAHDIHTLCAWLGHDVNASAVTVTGICSRSTFPSSSQRTSLHCCDLRSPLSPRVPAYGAAWGGEDVSRLQVLVVDELDVLSSAMTQRHSSSDGGVDDIDGSGDLTQVACWRSAPPAIWLPHSLASSSARAGRRHSVFRASGTHVPADIVLDNSHSLLGLVYHSCSLWEVVSLISAIAWLLVCLAA